MTEILRRRKVICIYWCFLCEEAAADNLHKTLATETSLFEIVLGRKPMTALDVAKTKNQGKCPAATGLQGTDLK